MRCASGSGVRLPKFIVPTTSAGGDPSLLGSRYRSMGAVYAARTCFSSRCSLSQRPVEVLDQIFRRLEPDGDANQPVGDPDARAFLGGEPDVGARRGAGY